MIKDATRRSPHNLSHSNPKNREESFVLIIRNGRAARGRLLAVVITLVMMIVSLQADAASSAGPEFPCEPRMLE